MSKHFTMAKVTKQGSMSLIILLVLIPWISGYGMYQDRIPNGKKIPHPCDSSQLWPGVGHQNTQGGGARNPFGLDFAANGHKWDATLCRKDSDGDGRTNGEELGDPNCVWTAGAGTQDTTAFSHPGVCEPYNSPECMGRNTWDVCQKLNFECDAINQPDVKNITIRLPETPVPAVETTYICVIVDLPTDGDYHIIAETPLIDNTNVMHHIVMSGCHDSAETKSTPYLCGMEAGLDVKCGDLIGGWALGGNGACYPPEAGIRIGSRGYKRVKMELHWNNPERRSDYTDQSGMVFYYTSNLRQYDLGTFVVGQMSLTVPPTGGHVTFGARCGSACTSELLEHNIMIEAVNLHMHYLGYSAKLDHFRNGQLVQTLGEDVVYQYDTPVNHILSPPVEFRPGDEFKLSCTFKPSTNGQFVFYGEDTAAEMCFGFINYYPKQNWTSCVDYADIPMCEMQRQLANQQPITLKDCDVSGFFTALGILQHAAKANVTGPPVNPNVTGEQVLWGNITYDPARVLSIWRHMLGLKNACVPGATVCTPTCFAAVYALKASDPCFTGDMYYFLTQYMSRWWGLSELLGGTTYEAIATCDLSALYAAMATTTSAPSPQSSTPVQISGTQRATPAGLLGLIMALSTLVLNRG
ncbi:MOXD1 homolog 1 isoform X2 [Lingula anatina]|uniref:MOXD1 homolog 1 isoform X2 n=1 Tax=Lingula anatina TaxID=7574 RepID=A0A1S3HZR4_LINAN|nr:MOXD1 homolog 1 isoform X2 [Lingula anatina]|eukprot:XP_013391507.1 MOXD1 homolog 1 isoform X2 [Lingula anatina]